jgi:hypothetical protein
MRTLIALGLFAAGSTPEILNCTLDQIETVTWAGTDFRRKLEPMRNLEGKPMAKALAIAGLGTARVTAKTSVLSLVLGEQVFPMDAGGRYVADKMDYADWYYAVTDQGVTVLEIPRKGGDHASRFVSIV